jgi:Tol biopolymer transport system component/DNA-binding winged helix-turn-helix (wHTH) protein
MSHHPQHLYEFGPFRLDAMERLLLRDGESMQLTPKSFDLLLALVEHHGHLLEKDELMKLVWPDTFVEETNLSSNISLIRKALGDGENGQKYIETVPKRGYRFVAGVREIAAEHAGINEAAARRIEGEARRELLISKFKFHRKGALLALAVSVIAIGGMAFGLYKFITRSESKNSGAEPKVIPLTSLPGQELQPTFSPDGNQIAFVWRNEKDGRSDIYIKLLDAENKLQLTNNPDDEVTPVHRSSASGIFPMAQINLADEVSPAWSPDGRSIAFVRRSPEGSGVYVAPVLGGAERKIGEVFADPFWSHSLGWTRDGRFLAVEDKNAPQEPFGIFLLSVETGEKRRLTSPPSGVYGDFDAAYSPDGKTIAFRRITGVHLADIYLVPAAGGEVRRLTHIKRDINGFAWTTEGREIIFSSSTSFEDGVLMKVSVPQGVPERLAATAQGINDPAISLRGDRLAYTQFLGDTNIWRIDLSASPKDRGDLPFISSSRIEESARYSPDGKKIVFTSSRSGTTQIWVCNSDGSNPRQLTNLISHNGEPSWSPDSRSIVFDSRIQGSADIFVIDAEGGQPRALTIEPSDDVIPSWSGDGRWVYFSSNRSGSMQLWKMPAQGGQPVQVTKQGGFLGRESVDGKFIYYLKDRGVPGIWRVPTEGGEEVLVLTHHKAGLSRAWVIVEKGIYFATAEDPAKPLIEFYSFATRKVTQVAALPKPFSYSLSISPDGRWLLYTQVDQSGSDIMLMENFR